MNNHVVLLVEDNDDDVELIMRSFEKHQLSDKIVITRNGQDALDYLLFKGSFVTRNRAEIPALILLDLKLPRVDGLEVLRQIRSHPMTQYIPVVILTTSSQASDIMQSYQSGANSYIRKPVDYDHFKELTRQLGLYWLTANMPPPIHT
jgi:two-component system response regulator